MAMVGQLYCNFIHFIVPLIEDDARCRKALQHHFKHPIEDLLAVNSAQSSLSPIITRYATPGHKPRLPSSPSPRTNRRQHEQESETDRLLPPQQWGRGIFQLQLLLLWLFIVIIFYHLAVFTILIYRRKRSTYSQWSSRSYGATHVSPDYQLAACILWIPCWKKNILTHLSLLCNLPLPFWNKKK